MRSGRFVDFNASFWIDPRASEMVQGLKRDRYVNSLFDLYKRIVNIFWLNNSVKYLSSIMLF